jgi:hypothetical protein
MIEQRTGRIVKWVKSWGLINSYREGEVAPDRFFVHITWIQSKTEVATGLRVTFTPGPPRTANELATARDVVVEATGGAA